MSTVIVPDVVTGLPVTVIDPEDESPTLVTVPAPPPLQVPPESVNEVFVAHLTQLPTVIVPVAVMAETPPPPTWASDAAAITRP